jgi:hypothetical protein
MRTGKRETLFTGTLLNHGPEPPRQARFCGASYTPYNLAGAKIRLSERQWPNGIVASNRSALGMQPSAASNSDAAYVEFEKALADVLAEHEQKYSIARRRALWSTTAFTGS